ncbi:MAG: TonB family protein [Acidobacteriota bacterium]|nr:TonB family protein [Acidobacteriota bacterium]
MAASTQVPITPQEAEPELSGSTGMSIALIGPNDAHRRIVANALAGSDVRSVREFLDYPGQITDLPRMIGQSFDVVIIDVDTDESYAIALIENIAAIGKVRVVAYSMRSNLDLEARCLRAGAHDFLPLPSDDDKESILVDPSFVEEAGQSGPEDLFIAEEQSALYNSIETDTVETDITETKQDKASSPASQNPVREPEPDAYDFTEWDARFLRRARPASAEVPETKPKPALAPEPPAEIEPQLAAPDITPPVAEIAPPMPEIALSAAESTPPAAEIALPEVKSAPPAIESRPPAAESRTSPVEIRPSAVATAPRPMESHPPAIARTLIPIDWADDELLPVSKEDAPLPGGGKVEIFRASKYKAEAGEDEDDSGKSRHNWIKRMYIPAGVGLVAGLLFLIFGQSFRQVFQAALAEQSVALHAVPSAQNVGPLAWTPNPAPKVTSSTPKSWKTISDASVENLEEPEPMKQVSPDIMEAQLTAPSRISVAAKKPAPVEEPPAALSPVAIESGASVPGAVFGGASQVKVEPAASAISAGVAEGLLIHRTAPLYPAFAREHNLSGTVVLSATITRTGAIAGLRVLSGPSIFRNAAVDAVKTWRYKPYMLDNQAVEVQTTISVVFKTGDH